MKPVLELRNVSKQYKIGAKQMYYSLRDSITTLHKRKKYDTFWALDNISFDVMPGESLALIGKNGAGKSTLLKILSRITPPTKGTVTFRGQVASLLEVGTGFHGELTGRENVFLNGSILGLKREEIKSKFDAILDFAGIEQFIDTPLKRYSSGMQLRLAFSVAAHLDPEILIIDEVLAVGDLAFQKKCINRMMDIRSSGRTILFVSHNFSAIRAFCTKAVLLEKGKKTAEGDIETVIEIYNTNNRAQGTVIDAQNLPRVTTTTQLMFDKIAFSKLTYPFGSPIELAFKLKSNKPGYTFREVDIFCNILDKNSNILISLSNNFLSHPIELTDDNVWFFFQCDNILRPDVYALSLYVRSYEVTHDYLHEVIQFEISDGNPYGYYASENIFGSIFPNFQMQQLEKNPFQDA